MVRSLRFRLPAFFLAGIVLSGLVATAIALRLFQDYALQQSRSKLRREAAGLTQLYEGQALAAQATRRKPLKLAPAQLEKATGDKIFYLGTTIFPRQNPGLRPLPQNLVEWTDGKVRTFTFRPPGFHRPYLAVSHPLLLGPKGPPFGALVVATPQAELRSRWITLIERLALASVGGLLVAGAFGWYLSRRITGPVLELSRAADEVAEGRYGVAVPSVPGGGEIGHLADRFREMAARLSETEELERNFLMSVSHELRTPLTAIKGHVEALREGVADDPELRAASLDVIASEAGRLERLVRDVLDLAKLDSHRFTVTTEEVDMERLCEQAYAAFAEQARRRAIEYRRSIPGEIVIVSDGDRVLQIITNLLSNAFRWTPEGGRIELSLRHDDGAVAVAVQDTGPGIAPEQRERIFRPFWSLDGSGTGLGLAIARELANALGGTVRLETEIGAGSRFELVLPGRPSQRRRAMRRREAAAA